jgi:hypothetical protein
MAGYIGHTVVPEHGEDGTAWCGYGEVTCGTVHAGGGDRVKQ